MHSVYLTPQEQKVLSCIAEHLTDAEIAARYKITASTVRFHMCNIRAKMNVKSRGKAYIRAQELGLLP